MPISAEVETVSPKRAAEYLEGHENYRRCRDHKVAHWARDIKAGRWVVAEPIIFDEDGKLIDGQHRLAAIIQAGIAVQLLVVRGVKREAKSIINSGIVRRGADALRASGITDRPVVRQALIRLIHFGANAVEGGSAAANLVPGSYPILHEIYGRAVDFCIQCFPSTRKGLSKACVTAVWGRAYLAHPEFEDRLRLAAEKFQNFSFTADDEPLRLLARYVSQRKSNGRTADYLKTARALYAWLHGEKLKTLYACDKDPFEVPTRYLSRVKAKGFGTSEVA